MTTAEAFATELWAVDSATDTEVGSAVGEDDVWAVESAVEAFETAYHHSGAADPAAYCPPPSHPLHLPTLRELLRADLEFAHGGGRLDGYRERFPRVFADPTSLAAVAFEEYRQRLGCGETVQASEYAERYGVDVGSWAESVPADTELRATAVVKSVGAKSASPAAESTPIGGASVYSQRVGAAPEANRLPEPGEQFAGFKLVRELGRGTFARVFLAEQPELAGRWVALKVSAELADESQTLARLQHTNVVPVYSVHRVGRLHAVCMPYFGGTTLADVLAAFRDQPSVPHSGKGFASTVEQRKDETVRTPADGGRGAAARPSATPLDRMRGMTHAAAVLWVGAELADGLAYAHDRGILHRDVKPANVLVADDGRPMLLDFNLAAAVGGHQPAGGTPFYMAPEQLAALAGAGGGADARSDVYALGLVLYELLTGRPPFDPPPGTMKERVMHLRAARAMPPRPASRLNREVTPAVDAVLARCLQPDPAARYATAHQLRDDLKRQLANLPLQHTPEPSARERAAKFLRRNPWAKSFTFLASATAAVVVGGAVTVGVIVDQRDTANRAVTERQFRDELAAHKVSLLAPADERRKAANIARARDTLTRFGLPGGDAAAKPAQPLDGRGASDVRDDVAELHLLLATAEATRHSPEGFANATGWLDRGEKAAGDGPARDRIARVRGLLDRGGNVDPAAPAAPAAPGDLSAEVLALLSRNEAAKLVALLDRQPSSTLEPLHWVAKAQCQASLGKFADAAASYTAAIARNGKPNYDLLAARGRAHLDAGAFARAVVDFDAALDLDPDAAECRIDRGLANMGLGRPADAVPDLDAALKLWPTHTRTLFVRSTAKAKAGDAAGAAADQKLALASEPGDAQSWVCRGVAKLDADAKAAVADFDNALVLDPHHRDALLNKAAALADRLGKPADAVDALGDLLDAEPDCVQARAGRAVYLARLGRRDAAHADAAAVLAGQPSAFFRYQMAGVYSLTSGTHPADAAQAVRLLASALQDRVGLEYVDIDTDLEGVRGVPSFNRAVQAARVLDGLKSAK